MAGCCNANEKWAHWKHPESKTREVNPSTEAHAGLITGWRGPSERWRRRLKSKALQL